MRKFIIFHIAFIISTALAYCIFSEKFDINIFILSVKITYVLTLVMSILGICLEKILDKISV